MYTFRTLEGSAGPAPPPPKLLVESSLPIAQTKGRSRVAHVHFTHIESSCEHRDFCVYLIWEKL